MAGYSIDDILAELDAKKNGTPLPQKKSVEEETPKAEEKAEAPEENKDFATDNKTSVWDSIKPGSHDDDDDLDVPPSLRAKLRARKKRE